MWLRIKGNGQWATGNGVFHRGLWPIACCLFLIGCGFQPLYGRHGEQANFERMLAGVKVESVKGRMGQELRTHLEDKLNPDGAVPPRPAYRLVVDLSSSESAIGVARDGTVSRYNVTLASTYQLYRTADNTRITSGSLQHVSSYNNLLNSYFSTYISKEDAISRGIGELAELYRQRLASYLTQDNPPIDTGDPKAPAPTAPRNPSDLINPPIGQPI